MKYELREYQRSAVRAVIRGFLKGIPGGPGAFTKLLLLAATGAGKTIMMAALAWWIDALKGRPNGTGRILILADTDELVGQAADKVFKATGLIADIEKARDFASLESPIVVGSIQTLSSRWERWPAGHFDLVCADEAHLSMAANWQKVLGYFHEGGAWILGVTATPERGDGQKLMAWYEHIAYEIGLYDLIDMGMLSPLTVQVCPITIDCGTLKAKTRGAQAGDFDADELEEAIEPYWHAIIDQWELHARDRKTLWFHPSVKSSQKFASLLQARGHAAGHVDGKTKDRGAVRLAFEDSRLQHLCNSKLLQKGYDCDDIGCVVNLAPGKSRTDYLQKIGRGTRLAREKGKTDCLILDFLWQFQELGIQRPGALIAATDEQALAIERVLARGKKMTLKEASVEAEREREQMVIARLKKAASKARHSRYDARDLGALLHQPDLVHYEPRAKWEKMQMTRGQKAFLEQQGVDPNSVKSLGHAFKIMETLAERRKRGLATPRQIAELVCADVEQAEQLTFKQAMDTLDRLIAAAPEVAAVTLNQPTKALPTMSRGFNLDS